MTPPAPAVAASARAPSAAGAPSSDRPPSADAAGAVHAMERDPSPADLRSAAAGHLAQRLSAAYWEEHRLLPVALTETEVVIAAGDAVDPTVLDELCWVYDRRVRVVAAPAAEVHAAILSVQSTAAADSGGTELRGADLVLLSAEHDAIDDVRALANQAPVIKLVNLMILEALGARASDIHIETVPDGLRVRYRIDGVLQDVSHAPRQFQAAVISRLKIMAGLNIAERRLTQDGRIRLRLSDRELDLRVSIAPTLHGEGVVLRVLDRGAGVRDLDDLGLGETVQRELERLIRQPHGIILVTGPTGSGKTTTLYGALTRLNAPAVKIVTVEDPVEYQIEGVTQIPVNPKTGLTFAAALRSILRHDPDVIMVGEMRDRETADIAIQAALTGHLVLSTLHTNDAPSGVARMVDMGIEPYLVTATVTGILAQRLVRMVCAACAEEYRPAAELLADFDGIRGDLPRPQFRRGRGCEACSGTGYRGRTGIYELMRITDETRARILSGLPVTALRAQARADGLVPLRASGWAAACVGLTTLEEVIRVTRDEAR